MTKDIKIVFFGSGEFAVPFLNILRQEQYPVVSVITVPDMPAGRRQILTPPPVKAIAEKFGYNIVQDLKIEGIKDYGADLGIVADYGKIIPQAILDLFPLGCLNIHPSLLPKYRGPSPIQTAILNGDKETGVTIIKLDSQMDHGPIIASVKLTIDNLNAMELSEKLAQAGADLLIKTLPDYLSGEIKPLPQNERDATFTKILKREDGKIIWERSALEIERQIRAYFPWPGAFAEFVIKMPKQKAMSIKLVETSLTQESFKVKPGELMVKINQLYIQCFNGALLIKKLHPQGKKEMTGQEFIRGYIR